MTKIVLSSQLTINDAHSMTNTISSQIRHKKNSVTSFDYPVTKVDRHWSTDP
jgi:hypothetical protein